MTIKQEMTPMKGTCKGPCERFDKSSKLQPKATMICKQKVKGYIKVMFRWWAVANVEWYT